MEPETEPAEDGRCTTPVCLVLGMAGSGKTTLVDTLSAWLEEDGEEEEHQKLSASLPHEIEMQDGRKTGDAQGSGGGEDDDTSNLVGEINNLSVEEASSSTPQAHVPKASVASKTVPQSILEGDGAYVINLDPAVYELPYEPNIDIRDTIKYKDVMREYSLGPNGAIITSLNLYATRFDQVLSLIEKRAPECKAVILDTPGQIETFTWSASGSIITDALGLVLPTIVLFVVDTKRCESAMTFVSNMLYACSIMYKTRLPMVIVFNKTDVVSCKLVQAWMEDYDTFDAMLKEENFIGTLARSMAEALEEFYKTMRSVGVSAHTGEGMAELVQCVKEAQEEYEQEYRPVLEERKRAVALEKEADENEQVSRIKRDLEDEDDEKYGDSDESVGDDEGRVDQLLENEDENMTDQDDERLAKMKGVYYDEEAEQKAYEEFMRKFNDSKGKDT